MIVDAGGGTVDISSYEFTSVEPLSVEEIAAADCKFSVGRLHRADTHGLSTKASLKDLPVSICGRKNFSTVRTALNDDIPVLRSSHSAAEELKDSKFGHDEDIMTMMEQFEKAAKATFRSPSDPSFIRFGSMHDDDDDFGIRSGQLRLDGCVCPRITIIMFQRRIVVETTWQHSSNPR